MCTLCMKSALRYFKLISRLKVNFHKSKLGEICVEEAVIEMFDSFLNCRMMNISFVFLGIPIGANPRKERTRQSIIQKINVEIVINF